MNINPKKLCATGALWNTLGARGIDIAETLADLSDEAYRQALAAIALFRTIHRATPANDAAPSDATIH